MTGTQLLSIRNSRNCNGKTTSLFGWWAFADVFYLLLLLGVGYAPNRFKQKLIGNINACYLFALLKILSSWTIAIHYAHMANKHFDRLTEDLVIK